MSDYQYTPVDFDHPSFLFLLEDKLKSFLGGFMFYNSYLKSFGLKGTEKVLDFGCGSGIGSRHILKLLNKNGHLTCIDTSTYWMKKAVKRLRKFPNTKCILGDICQLNIPDRIYDVISINHVIHDIEPEKRQNIVNVLSQKLKNGGYLFIREPVRKSHGIAVKEIRTLLKNVNLREAASEEDKTEYKGKFLKIK